MPSRSSDPIDHALSMAVGDIVSRAQGLGASVILIDGRSGSGKTSLSRRLIEAWPGVVQVLALDSVYPGWDGLAAGASSVIRHVLYPLRHGEMGTYSGWDWALNQPASGGTISPERALIVEGCGILTPQSRELSDLTVWVEADDADRRRRALERDGEAYEPHWEQWAAQEDEHIRAHQPASLADLIITIPREQEVGP